MGPTASIIFPFLSIRKSIIVAENSNYDIETGVSKEERANLVIWFFEFIKIYDIAPRVKEKVLVLLDKVSIIEDLPMGLKKLSLISLVHVNLKIETGVFKIGICNQMLDSINKKNLSNSSIIATMKLLNQLEYYLSTKLEWNLNVFIISDYFQYFHTKYFSHMIKSMEKSERYLLFLEYFTEYVYCMFNSYYIPMHVIALCAILLSFDQMSESQGPFFYTRLANCLESVQTWEHVDLLRVNLYKHEILSYIDQYFTVAINRIYPDKAIFLALKIQKESLFKDDGLCCNIIDNNNVSISKTSDYTTAKGASKNKIISSCTSKGFLEDFVQTSHEEMKNNMNMNQKRKRAVNIVLNARKFREDEQK